MKKRNSLIELYRFFFAMNVVKNHGFLPSFGYFSPGRVSVEFFFVLSGYLFLRSLEKLKDLPLKESLPKLIVSKMKPLFIPVAIGWVSNFAYWLVSGEPFDGLWGYLWYVHALLLIFIAYLVIRKYIKDDKKFFFTVGAIFVIATALRFSNLCYSWGYVRAFESVSLGILLAKLPSIDWKKKNLLWLVLVPLQIVTLLCVAYSLGNVETVGGFRWVELLMDVLLYPALIYLTFQLPVDNKIFNYLGALSFGLYAFQCPADLFRLLGLTNVWILFAIIVISTLIEDGAKRYLSYTKAKPKKERELCPNT